MKQRAHYFRLYRQLGLTEHASIKDLKYRYHHLASRYHPDKSANKKASTENIEAFKEVQAAYQELKSYHNIHKQLPLEILNISTDEKPPIYETSKNPKTTHFSITSLLTIFVALSLIVLIIIPAHDGFLGTSDNQPASDTSESATYTSTHGKTSKSEAELTITELNTHPITLGMSMGKVFELLGVPDDTVGNNWYYGNSEIYFRDGFVAGWIIDPASRIKIDTSLPLIQIPPPLH